MNLKILIISLLLSTSHIGIVYAQFSRLHIKTPTTSTMGISTGGPSGSRIIGINHDGTAGVISTTTLNGVADPSPMKFATGGQVRMTIFEDGTIGVGTNGVTSGAMLAIGGRVQAREVKVNVSTGADYVFGDTYKLPSLQEVQAYIRQHKHLPEVPAASEMENDGLSLGEMNILLLKKIEELTLYTIQQSEDIATLKKQMLEQQQMITKLQEQIK